MTRNHKTPLPTKQSGVPQEAKTNQLPVVRPVTVKPVPRSQAWKWGAFGLVGVLIAALGYAQFGGSQPPVVAVEVATYAPATRVLAVNGRIAAVTVVDIHPSASGIIVAPLGAEGGHVAKGQIIAQVDPSAPSASLRQSMAALDAALISKQQAKETYDRAVLLGGNISRTELLTATHALETASFEATRQTAAFEQAQIMLETYAVRAPFDGTILSLNTEVGALVGPATPLFTLADLSNLIVEADVDEAYAAQIAFGQPAVLQLSGEVQTRDAKVSFVSQSVNTATGGLAVKMAFDAPVTAPIGMTVTANIIVDQRDQALTIPRTALQSDAKNASVFVVRNDTAVLQSITVVEWPADRLIVTSGLSENDEIVVDAAGISDGQSLSVKQP